MCDISENMLSVGRQRAEALGYHGIKWVCGDAQKLPFDDDEFDCYTIAFGIRNVVDVQKVRDGGSQSHTRLFYAFPQTPEPHCVGSRKC